MRADTDDLADPSRLRELADRADAMFTDRGAGIAATFRACADRIAELEADLAKHRRAITKMTPAVAPAYIPYWVKDDLELYPDD